jgi:magnesium transporter
MAAQWFDIRDPNAAELDELATRYGLHPLHVEDCRHRNQNAKVEAQASYLFVVLKTIELDEDGAVATGDFDLFLGSGWLITVQEKTCAEVCDLLEHTRGRAEGMRSDQLFHRLMDQLVDSYQPVMDALSHRIDQLEDLAITCPEPAVLEDIFTLRRALIDLRRMLSNSRDVLGHLLRSEYSQIGRDLQPFLRDVYDHLARYLDTIEGERDLITGATELYLTSVANRTNQTMKTLTVLGTIATPALVITGMYGMNLRHLPFQDHVHSWGIVILMIAAVSAVTLGLLRWMRVL